MLWGFHAGWHAVGDVTVELASPTNAAPRDPMRSLLLLLAALAALTDAFHIAAPMASPMRARIIAAVSSGADVPADEERWGGARASFAHLSFRAFSHTHGSSCRSQTCRPES